MFEANSKLERAYNLIGMLVMVSVSSLVALFMAMCVAPLWLLWSLYQLYIVSMNRRTDKWNGRDGVVTHARNSILLSMLVVVDVFVLLNMDGKAVDENGSPNSVSGYTQYMFARERFFANQLAIVDQEILAKEAQVIISPTEEARKLTGPQIASFLSSPEIQKALTDANASKTPLQRWADAHERYAETLRQQDAINSEKVFLEFQRRQELEQLYRTKNLLTFNLAKAR